MMTERIAIPLADRSYDIVIGGNLLAELGTHLKPVLKSDRVIIVSDTEVARFWLHRTTGALEAACIQSHTVIIPSGEQSKQLDFFAGLIENILSHAPDRDTTILALGGGVVGDMAGFAASCALRGLPYVQIPTSLLAQVDSAVGGKTAVNSKHGKNLIGSFYQPQLVITDTSTLSTLPERHIRAGYAEILKYALIGDAAFFDWLDDNGEKLLALEPDALAHAIKTSCKAKAAIVAEDETEHGTRALLNLGHTFGHALEVETGMSDALLHGEAVALGMILAFETSVEMGLCPVEDLQKVQAHYAKLGLPCRLKDTGQTFDANALASHFAHDKKSKNGQPVFILARGIGKAFIEPAADMQKVLKILEKACTGE